MNITASYEISNNKIENIEEMISEVQQAVLGIGREIVKQAEERAEKSAGFWIIRWHMQLSTQHRTSGTKKKD